MNSARSIICEAQGFLGMNDAYLRIGCGMCGQTRNDVLKSNRSSGY